MKNLKAFSIATIVSTVIITLSAIIEELSVSFKNSLSALTGHSWITQSIIGILSFVILSVIFCYIFKTNNKNLGKYIWATFFAVLACSIALFLFFVFHA